MTGLSKVLLACFCLAGGLVGVSLACQLARAEEPAPPQTEPIPETCRAWIAHMVDGRMVKGPAIIIPNSTLAHISVVCLGRFPHPLEGSPHPLRPEPEPEPIPPAKPQDDGEKITL